MWRNVFRRTVILKAGRDATNARSWRSRICSRNARTPTSPVCTWSCLLWYVSRHRITSRSPNAVMAPMRPGASSIAWRIEAVRNQLIFLQIGFRSRLIATYGKVFFLQESKTDSTSLRWSLSRKWPHGSLTKAPENSTILGIKSYLNMPSAYCVMLICACIGVPTCRCTDNSLWRFRTVSVSKKFLW